MSGEHFINDLIALADKAGDLQEDAKQVRGLYDLLHAGSQKRILKADTKDRAASILKTQAKSFSETLDKAAKDGQTLLAAFEAAKPKKKSDTQAFLKWIDGESAAGKPNEAAAKAFSKLLEGLDPDDQNREMGADAFREKLKSAQSPTALLDIIADTKTTVETSNALIDKVATALPSGGATMPTDFFEFLAIREGGGNATAGTLRQILKQSPAKSDILEGKTKLSQIMDAIDLDTTKSLNSQQQLLMKSAATELFNTFNTEPAEAVHPNGGGPLVRFLTKPQSVTIAGIILVAGLVIGYVLFFGKLGQFADNEVARGFITLLFAVGSISIFLVITAAIVFDVNSNSREIYERAKTILSMFLGIFGTVLGFYYGVPKDDQTASDFALRPLQVLAPANDAVNVVTSVTGGKAPYEFLVQVAGEKGEDLGIPITSYQSLDGTLVIPQPFKLEPAKIKEAGIEKISIRVTASDANGTSLRLISAPRALEANGSDGEPDPQTPEGQPQPQPPEGQPEQN